MKYLLPCALRSSPMVHLIIRWYISSLEKVFEFGVKDSSCLRVDLTLYYSTLDATTLPTSTTTTLPTGPWAELHLQIMWINVDVEGAQEHVENTNVEVWDKAGVHAKHASMELDAQACVVYTNVYMEYFSQGPLQRVDWVSMLRWEHPMRGLLIFFQRDTK